MTSEDIKHQLIIIKTKLQILNWLTRKNYSASCKPNVVRCVFSVRVTVRVPILPECQSSDQLNLFICLTSGRASCLKHGLLVSRLKSQASSILIFCLRERNGSLHAFRMVVPFPPFNKCRLLPTGSSVVGANESFHPTNFLCSRALSTKQEHSTCLWSKGSVTKCAKCCVITVLIWHLRDRLFHTCFDKGAVPRSQMSNRFKPVLITLSHFIHSHQMWNGGIPVLITVPPPPTPSFVVVLLLLLFKVTKCKTG